MLYHLYEFKKAAQWPAHVWSKATGIFLKHLPFKDEFFGRLLLASNEILERSTRSFGRPEFGIDTKTKAGQGVEILEKTIIDKPFCKIKQFIRFSTDGQIIGADEPNVLIVAPLSGHYTTLLRDTVDAMIADHNVYITDWQDASRVPLSEGRFDLQTYIDYLLDVIVRLGNGLHILAVCQSTVPVLAAVSILAKQKNSAQPASMILMGGPIDTRINPGVVCKFAKEHDLDWFRRNLVTDVPFGHLGYGRLVCPGFIMLSGFMSMNIDRHQEAQYNLFVNLVKNDIESADKQRAFYNEYRSVMDVPAEYYLDCIHHVFHDHSLPRGIMQWGGGLVDPALITKTALMTVEGERDDISNVGQTYAAHDLCSGIPQTRKRSYVQSEAGHYGIFNGKRWRTEIQPRIAVFIREFSGKD
ncbi:MAG: polyhydroxyalkanoate depolymerase [Alphaproteobacteria bacterium]|nr:polyhydroxyalkanoate depolymerase [Alphaproteobacteria bacterium]